jgi:(1->4)-alpha-D-glucan 1-alpha-D-glucosylmutase
VTPRATYRLQLTAGFRFADAAALAPYLARLGVSHVYASPVFAARPGSTHGYDVTDPTRLNPELGSEDDFRAMAAAFRAEGLGLVLDIVPNHMGVGGATNRFWLSVLEWGRESPFAHWFDIDWASPWPGLAGKVLVPFLGADYVEVLETGGLELRFDPDEGSFAVWAHGAHKLPVCPRDYARILDAAGLAAPEAPDWEALKARLAAAPSGSIGAAVAAFNRNRARLDALIGRQHWRASCFTLAGDAINYRRFFTISDLAGLRVEDPEVFEATHALILRLVGEGLVDGLRVDHIDGLRDPQAYTLALRRRAARPFWLLVEKILAPGEALPADWQADGTTGYEVANLLVGLLADPAGTEALTRAYAEFTGQEAPAAEVVHAAKRAILEGPMAAELDAVLRRLLELAGRQPRHRDLGRTALKTALVETVAALSVYRTYADADGLPAADQPRLAAALVEAQRRSPGTDPAAFDFLAAVLGLEVPGSRDIALRVQQLSGPVMAKGLEDTALYRYNRLIALNEVGSEPGCFTVGLDEFHRANAERLARTPLGLIATSTHDTKRGEDARARIVALSGRAAPWGEKVREWHAMLADPSRPIDRNEEYFFYQLLLGAWPDGGPDAGFAERVEAAMLKSVREAGVNTRWIFGDPGYEQALSAFVARALDPAGAFLASFAAFAALVEPDGAANGLIQTALKLTIPGVPDIYQGAELRDLSLVDPDNRRPVDFALRAATLARLTAPGAARPAVAAAKLALIAALLGLRRARPALFAEGSYEPVPAAGHSAASFCAFVRRHGADTLLVAAALHPGTPKRWADTRPAPSPDLAWPLTDLLTGAAHHSLDPPRLFRDGPLALLVGAQEVHP